MLYKEQREMIMTKKGETTMRKSSLFVLVLGAMMLAMSAAIAHAQSNSNPATSCQTCGVTPGPIACWPMNDSNGSTVLQEVIGNNNAGPVRSPVGAAQAPQPIPGRFGGAIDFVKFPGTGLTGAVVGNMSGSLPYIGQADFSIVTWIKFPPTSASAPPTGPGGRHYIINKYGSSQGRVNGYALYVIRPSGSNSSYLEFLWGDDSNPPKTQTLRSSTPITPNQWHLVAVTFARNVSGNPLTVTLYVDGAPKGTYTSTSPWGSLVNSLAIMIGYQPSSVDEPIALDELQIYNRALTANEISQIYNACSGPQPCVQPPSGMVAWYWMDGNVKDFATLGGHNNPSAINAISFVAGKDGQGVTFGPGGYIEIPDSPALANQRFTIDAWVKPQGPGPNNDFWGSVIVEKGRSAPTGYTDVPIALGWSAQQQKFVFTFGNINTDRIVSSSTFSTGQWYHVAATYDGQTFKLYVNGMLEGTMVLVKTIVYDPAIPWTIGSTASHIRAAGYPRTFNGVIDEVEIFKRALSQAEIQAIYKPGKCKKGGGPFDPTD
jgi:hypothetical protein